MPKRRTDPAATQRARTLRRTQTDAETVLWQRLRNRQLAGHKFRRQVPIGCWFADFACLEKKLIVELDGGQHVEQAHYDSLRTLELATQGFKVLRFWNDDVLGKSEDVLEEILRQIELR